MTAHCRDTRQVSVSPGVSTFHYVTAIVTQCS